MPLTLENLQSLLTELSWLIQLFVAILSILLILLPILRTFTFYHNGPHSVLSVFLRVLRSCARALGLHHLTYILKPINIPSASHSMDEPKQVCLLAQDCDAELVSGLVNTGNSCFLNSVLQALSSLPHLQAYLDEMTQTSDTVALPVSRALFTTLRKLSRPLRWRSSFRPRDIVGAMSSNRMVINREQQDAQELFQLISSAIDTEGHAVARASMIGGGLKDILGPYKLNAMRRPLLNTHASRLENPFIGLLANRLSCIQCGYTEAIRHFSFNNVQLTLTNTCSTTLYDCLDRLTSMEYLNDATCRKCSLIDTVRQLSAEVDALKSQAKMSTHAKKKREVLTKMVQLEKTRREIEDRLNVGRIEEEPGETLGYGILRTVSRMSSKQAMFAKTPKVLSLHVSRSAYHPSGFIYKNKCHIEFPEFLDLSAYCTTGTLHTLPHLPISTATDDTNGRTMYRLMSIIVHYGSHNFGHFIAYKRRVLTDQCSCTRCHSLPEEALLKGQEEWYRISDEKVDLCAIDEVLEANPYMLLYEVIEDNDTPLKDREQYEHSMTCHAEDDLAVGEQDVESTPDPLDLPQPTMEAIRKATALLQADPRLPASSPHHAPCLTQRHTNRHKTGRSEPWNDDPRQSSAPLAIY